MGKNTGYRNGVAHTFGTRLICHLFTLFLKSNPFDFLVGSDHKTKTSFDEISSHFLLSVKRLKNPHYDNPYYVHK